MSRRRVAGAVIEATGWLLLLAGLLRRWPDVVMMFVGVVLVVVGLIALVDWDGASETPSDRGKVNGQRSR